MAKLPRPPSPEELRRVPPDLVSLERATRVWRIYFRAAPRLRRSWRELRHFGPTASRFDHHVDPPRVQERGILYAAMAPATCFAEVFQTDRCIDRTSDAPWLVSFALARTVVLLDLTGPWPTRAGASMNIASGPHRRAREWSRATYEAYPQVDGLLYPSSMDANHPALALYERTAGAIPAAPDFNRPLDDPGLTPLVEEAARRFGYAIT